MSDGVENLPIDITSNKLLDWLIDRRHVPHKWQPAAIEIQKKISLAIQDMPEVEEIKTLLAGTYINYFHCLRILELLKVSESGSKNIFGYYSSQRMKDWQEIVTLYEKDDLYLAEVADMLVRNVAYEVPWLRKQMGRCQQTRAECDKKDKYYADAAVRAKEEYHQYCKQLGIKGERIRPELLALVSELPEFYTSLTTDVKTLSGVVEFYQEFVRFTIDSVQWETTPLLHHLMAHENTTTYQWRTKRAPDSIEEVKLWFLEEEETTNEDEIDWGIVSEDVDDIDFNITIEDVGTVNEGGVNSGEIDWNVESHSKSVDPAEDGVARGNDALTVLDIPATRNQFVNELLELEAFSQQRMTEMKGAESILLMNQFQSLSFILQLEAFLQQRMTEMKGDESILLMNQFQSAPVILQMKNVEDLQKMVTQVSAILARVTDTRIQHLFMLKSSPKYVDRLAEMVNQKKDLEEKMLASQIAMQERRKTSTEEEKQLKPREQRLIGNTRALQKQIEKDISKRYKNRPVNIMGAINAL